MSHTLVPTNVGARVDVHDLRGAPARAAAAPILHDPTGQRARRLRLTSRTVMGLLGIWLIGLCLAGLGLVPAGMIPLGSLVSAPAPKRLVALSAGPQRAVDGRPGAASAFGVVLQLATGQRAPLVGPPVPVSFARRGVANGSSAFGRPEIVGVGLDPAVMVDGPSVAGSPSPTAGSGEAGASPAPSAPVERNPGASAPQETASQGNGLPSSTATPEPISSAPGNSGNVPPRADGASPGASGAAPGRAGDVPAAGDASSPPAHSNAGGNNASPPANSNAGGNGNADSANAGGNGNGAASGNASSNAGGNAGGNGAAAANSNAGGNGNARGRADKAS